MINMKVASESSFSCFLLFNYKTIVFHKEMEIKYISTRVQTLLALGIGTGPQTFRY